MSRISLTWPRLSPSEWDRPAADTRLLPHPFPRPVSLGSPRSPSRVSLAASAPSQSPVRKPPAPPYSRPARAAYARSALPGVDADARVSSRMNACSALPGVDADACVNSWMNACSAPTGVDADACANPADDLFRPDPTRTTEGALATLTLSIPMPREGSLTPARQCTPQGGVKP